jgi:hypothetical protein
VTLVNSIRSPSRGEAAAMLGDLGIDQLVADGAQLRERPRLIGFHETRVTYHVRRNDYCEPSQEHVLCHHPPQGESNITRKSWIVMMKFSAKPRKAGLAERQARIRCSDLGQAALPS